MNEPHEVSTNIPAEAQTQQIDKHTQLQKEATEHEILQQTQPTSNANQNVTIPSDKEPLLQHTYTGSSQEINNHSQNENEIEPEEPIIVNINITEKKYNIIYAEPSWEDDQSSEELLKLPVRRVADENCALFLWVNPSMIPEALNVIKEWGFKYEAMPFIWVKRTKNKEGKIIVNYDETSKWTRESTEVCLLATKGTLQRVNDNIPQVATCISEKNYLKPEYFKECTVQLLGNLPTLELFPYLGNLEDEIQFTSTYNGQHVEWDMAAPKILLEQIAEDRRIEMNRASL